MTTRKEVAEQAGVSEATVSRVFSEAALVNPETKKKVLLAAEQLGYFPNALAQSFARKKSMNIGVVLPYIPKVRIFSYDYFSDILSGASEEARQHGYDLLLLYRDAQQKEVDYRTYFQNKKVDGCILLGTFSSEREHLLRLREEGVPFVLVSHALYEKDPYAVIVDHVQGSYDVIKHLVEEGHQNIAFLNGPDEFQDSEARLRGVEQAFTHFRVQNGGRFSGNFSRTSGYRLADHFLHRKPAPTALFAANDRMAIGFMQRLRELGIRPGEDIAIVGYDDSEIAEYMYPTLSSVAVPFFEMGRQAMRKLLRQFEAPAAQTPEDRRLTAELKVRESSSFPKNMQRRDRT